MVDTSPPPLPHQDLWLRRLERFTLALEAPLYRWVREAWLFLFYHTGTLAFWTLVLLAVTGLYVTLFYRFGYQASYASIQDLDANLVGRLMRSAHRYLGDLFLVFSLLHAWRMFVQNRFKGPRKWAWITGVAMLLLTGLIAVTGFWMLADQRAQWLHATLQGLAQHWPLVQQWMLGLLVPAAGDEGWWYMVLLFFLHVGLTLLLGLFYWWHIHHLQHPRWFPPRVWIIGLTLGVALLALVWPAARLPMWDFSRWPDAVPLNLFYLSWLPLTLESHRYIWALGLLLLFAFLGLTLPWWWKPRLQPAPVRLNEEACIGCTLCAQDCPYLALEMIPRQGPGPRWVARLHPQKCVGCGICVGSCPTDALALEHPGGNPQELRKRLYRAGQPEASQTTRVVVACQRHLDYLGERLTQLHVPQDLQVVSVPCVGVLHPDVLAQAWQAGARQVQVVGCPPEDCPERLGNRWLEARLRRLRKPWLRFRWRSAALTWHWIPPSEFPQVYLGYTPHGTTALLHHWEAQTRPWWRHPALPRAGLMTLILLLLAVWGNLWPYTGPAWAGQATLELALTHTQGQTLANAQPLVLPIDVSPGLYLWVDGQLTQYWPVSPNALGQVVLFHRAVLMPGYHQVYLDLLLPSSQGTPGEAWRLLTREGNWEPGRIYTWHWQDLRSKGDPERGRRLFFEQVPGKNTGCSLCHSLQLGENRVGPSLADIGTVAGQRIPGMGAEEYLKQSILEPDVYVVPGYPPGIMPPNYRELLTEEDVQGPGSLPPHPASNGSNPYSTGGETMKRRLFWWLLVLVGAMALSACGGQATPQGEPEAQAPAGEQAAPVTGDPQRGKELFQAPALAGQAGCSSCHSLEPDVTLVGPSLAGIGTSAAQRVPGMSAEEYLRQALLEPDAYVLEGFPKGIMPAYQGLSEQDLQDLIAFLLTLK